MPRHAPIRLAGTIAATALCAAAATEARAQTSPIVIDQVNLGGVFANERLDVAYPDSVGASAYAVGNTGSAAGDDGVPIQVGSQQVMRGDAGADVALDLEGEAYGPVNLSAQVEANRLNAQAHGANLDVQAVQDAGPSDFIAQVTAEGDPGRMLEGGYIEASSSANVAALGGSNGVVTAEIDQANAGFVQGYAYGDMQYIPDRAEFLAAATGNAVSSTVTAGDQDLTIRQRQAGAPVWATTSANAGNAWDLAGRARATANQVSVSNQGGSVIARTDQANASGVRAESIVTAFDFGAATAHAMATGNAVHVGNRDIYVRIDNAQLNSGGVEAVASFAGTTGYDAYVGADAVGNTITGYACSNCPGYLEVSSSQTNTANVTATATTRIDGSGRAVVTGVNAVGNSATFYVTRPGG